MAAAAVQAHIPSAYVSPEATQQRHHVPDAVLNFYKGDGSPPGPAIIGRPETYERPFEAKSVLVTDITGDEDKFTLDGHGFMIYKHESKEKEFDSDERIKAEYYPEVEQLLKAVTNAPRVFIFDHTIRREPKENERISKAQVRGPIFRVHVDQSYSGAFNRLSYELPDEAKELSQKRYQLINVWRPIKTIYKHPLAIAEAHSVPDSDLLPSALVYPDRTEETFTVKPSPNHRWYFKYAQRPDEVTLFKCFDSLEDGRARRVPHSAFVDPREEKNESRESIEIRAYVFYDY